MKSGAFTFVLHSHLPYARMAGRWPHGEEWIHEAATDTYLPLLAALHDLAGEGVRYRLTLSVTPVLAEQLADADVLRNLDDYIADLRERASRDIARFESWGDGERAGIARFLHGHFGWLLETFRDRFGRDIIRAMRDLQDRGLVEISTSAATHGYLPLFERDSSIHAQVRTGVRTFERHFGRKPESFWLPECAYRPARYANGARRPGIEEFLAAQGVRVFFVETQAILGGAPLGKTAGDVVGPYAEVGKRYSVPPASEPPHRPLTTFQPYWVSRPGVAAIGRNLATGLKVWSAEHGYPGDFAYREFHKKDGESGLHYWRVSGPGVPLGEKQLYDPQLAEARAMEHARHFATLVEDQVSDYSAESNGRYGIVSAAYDTELFGHWWFEGVSWLKAALRHLASSETVDLVSAGEFVREHPPEEAIDLPEGSWGQQGTHFTWLNADTQWMWPVINGCQRRIEEVVARCEGASGDERAALEQLSRELLLLESSDWPFLVTTGQARAYAELRFNEHAERFEWIARQIDTGTIDRRFIDDLWERDKLFPDIDPADFRERQGSADA